MNKITNYLLEELRAIKQEANSSTYEYDATPTGEERLKRISKLADRAISTAIQMSYGDKLR